MLIVIIYLGLCFALAKWAERIDGSFWWTFLMCLVLTPMYGLVANIISLAAKRDFDNEMRKCERDYFDNEMRK